MARLTALQLYKYLPGTNCGECEEGTCMGFAVKLVDKEESPNNCPYLKSKKKDDLLEILIPPVRAIGIGAGEDKITLGGEEVMYRHELRFFNPCALFLDISDTMDDAEIEKRVALVKNLEVERIGQNLGLQGISVRCASGDMEKFKLVVEKISIEFKGVIMLASFNPEVLKVGCEASGKRKPLLYAANEKNYPEVLALAKEYETAIVVHSDDLDELGTLTRKLAAQNFHNIILDPGIETKGKGLADTIDKFAAIRKSAVNNVPELRYPLMAVPAIVHNSEDENEDETAKSYYESLLTAILMDRFASMLVIHSTDIWVQLPLLYLNLNIYTDPRVEPMVEPKLYELGKVNENSPVLVSTNYALTYFALTGDLEGSPVPCYLLILDTEGLAVLVAVAAAKLTGKIIKEALEENKVAEKVKHKKIILPGYCSSIVGQVEDDTGWEVMLGPQDSSQLKQFLKDKWE